ncbi:ATPase [Cellvibrio zantedeschiae]|uniref:histidine kinase n=1 Tax=Cellvibrio zantedeschiae TaxID=1237077 RepID=A0ABQ3B6C3_9GAMM|nr:CHASE domain-containing protein [Cellvibrio zantedeschiae]GGY81941.1 ATPase [Cellvibrio zantedeschiae]
MHELVHRKNSKVSAALLLALLLLLTFFISWTMHRQSLRFMQLAFDAQVDELVQSIQLRMRDHEQLLLGAKGLYEASQTVERDEFHLYVNSLDVSKKYPGIQVVGFSEWIKPDKIAEFTTRIRDQGFPQFNIRPMGKRDHYSAIIFMEPYTSRNISVFGFDMFSEPVRRQAMSAAVATNQARLSGKVILLQEQSGSVQAGTLLYLPIFNKHSMIDTEAQRWNSLAGFVYAAFRMGDLMDGVLQQRKLNMHFTLYAGDSAAPGQELYASAKTSQENFTPAYEKVLHLELYGQPWLLKVVSDEVFERSHKSHLALIVFAFGVVINFLLCAIFYVLVNQRQHALSLAQIMTEDVQAKNAQLKNNQERFELALESSAMGIWSLRFGDDHMQWDSSMGALFGVHTEEPISTYERFLSFVHKDDRQRVYAEIAQAIEGKKGYDTEYRVVWPDHSVHYLASRAKIIYEGDDAVSMIGTCWDISERKRLDKVKTEFVSTVSHELRTPLTAITGALGLAVGGALCDLPDKAKQVLDIAYKNAQRLKLLINDLLDMDKLLAGKLEFHCEPQTLMPLIERAVMENRAYADQMQVRFVIAPMSVAPRVDIEDIRFLQIMANFLSNAAKFSKPDSEVVIKLSVIDDYARISVTDTGVGLDDESKSHIFEKFYQADSSDTRKKGGTGLGLAITKEIVERMNGRVGFSSVLGEGSTFYAEFPVVH